MSHVAPATRRSPGFGRGVSALALVVLTAGTGSVLVAPARAAGTKVPASQPLVVLLKDHVARTAPSLSAQRVETVAARRPLTRVRTVLPVLDHATSDDEQSWIKVALPGRPNGHTGWIPAVHAELMATEWHISVDISARQVTVHRDGRVERRFRAVVGKSSTPTPTGRFFVEEAVAISSKQAGGPFALAVSARSRVFQEFNGGPGQIAIHGTNKLSDPLGTAASHGCIRVANSAITWLAGRIGRGVPLTIKR